MPESTFLPVRDSRMQGTPEFAQALNYGSAPSLRHILLYSGETKTAWERTIVDFDVSELSTAAIIAAKLVRQITGVVSGNGPEAKLSRCTRAGEWVESQVTWLRYKSGADWTGAGGDFDDTGPPAALAYDEPTVTGEHEIVGLLPFVEDAIESRGGIVSLITRLSDEDPDADTGAQWFAKGLPLSWRLVVEYAPPDPGRRTTPTRTPSGITPAGPERRPHSPASATSHASPMRPHVAPMRPHAAPSRQQRPRRRRT